MTRMLLPVALLSIVCLTAQDGVASQHMRRNASKMRAQAAAMRGNVANAQNNMGNAQNNLANAQNNVANAQNNVANAQNNLAAPFVNPYLGYGYGPGVGFYPGYIPMIYPGVGYVSRVVPARGVSNWNGNIYTQSYFNSPAYGHWNGFGHGK